MAEKMKEISTRKRVLKAQFTKYKDKLKIDAADISELNLILEKCTTFKLEFKRLFDELYEHCDESAIDDYIEEQDANSEKLDDLHLQIIRKLKLCEKVPQIAKPDTGLDSLKLPKLSLPIFSGAITDWLTFKDLFIASVHKNSKLSDAQRLQYLKSSLKSEAFKIIQSIPITDNNYEIAWNLLEERFSNKREQIFAQIKKLTNLTQIQTESSSAILNLVDNVNETVRSLEILNQNIKGTFGDTLIMYLVLNKLDSTTKLWFERNIKIDEVPNLNDLLDFLKNYARTLQNSKPSYSKPQRNISKTTTLFNHNHMKCFYCNAEEQHVLQKCPKFLLLTPQERFQIVKSKHLCFNCLSGLHTLKHCKSRNTCRHCGKFHHSILHIESFYKTNKPTGLSPQAKPFVPTHESSSAELATALEKTICANYRENASGNSKVVLLCTAQIKVQNEHNNFIKCRCILDSGSQSSFIRKDFVNKLGLSVKDKNVSVSSLGFFSTMSNGEVELLFTPHFTDQFKVRTTAYVIEHITGKLPSAKLPENVHDYFCDLKLADPSFHEPGEIDVLLGVNVFLTLMKGDIIKRDSNLPFALSSKLGWIISGTTCFTMAENDVTISNFATNTDELIKTFWQQEQIPNLNPLTKEEKLCESYFQTNHIRDKNGRYTVSLPFKPEREELGDSKSIAFYKFIGLEKRLIKNPDTYRLRKEFMCEYLSLGHMEEVPKDLDIQNAHYYIPHHPVIKEASVTTKLRVVFNASSKTSSGVSLNDILMNGPKVQDDLFAILLRFRCQNIAITSDLQKMYRQILIQNEDREFQRILWRDDPSKAITPYRLNTVTYGTTSASYLATRVLKQLALDEEVNYPKAANILLHNCYIDDVLFGSSTVDEALELISQLSELLGKGGFQLHKWCSNDKSVLEAISKSHDSSNSACQIVNAKSIKVLGLKWEPISDEFICDFVIPAMSKHITKRIILSAVSSIFDPLGWLAPFIIAAKILIQEIWKVQISWDDPVPEEISLTWIKFYEQLPYLKEIHIPRRILVSEASRVELHAFCDASEKAYASVVYLKSNNQLGQTVKLLTSKTRVAPLKTISIPRLELCSAMLLTHLVQSVQNSLKINIDEIFAWSDSMIVLSWLQSEPNRWQTFVANRVSEIQSILPPHHWNHIRSQENPADCASRGLLPSELASHNLWWTGPSWLISNDIPSSNIIPFSEDALKEERKKASCCIGTINHDLSIIDNVSTFSKLKRLVAWTYRFINNAKFPSNRVSGFLSTKELINARNKLIRLVQQQTFSTEYHLLSAKQPLSTNNKILPLTPFLDEEGLIRVGGRLNNSNISHAKKHPILLPKNHRLTEMIIDHFHISYLHAGPSLLLSLIRQEFWIISARSIIRQRVWKCVKCHRVRANMATQIMADLPSSRVTPSQAFSKVGIDFAGPFLIKPRQGRGIRPVKGYMCIFVCFVTKAVHIELVGNLTSDSFIAALKRFVSRRGKPIELFSDCGTNFVAANKELQGVITSLKKDESVNTYFANEGIRWNFNPPSAPHFGGLWEAAVKSAKLHLKRTIGEQLLTTEEFHTLLCQIEACMNSRPLCPLPDDPSELSVLTPGHFLIGSTMTSVPEENIVDEKIPITKRWKMTQKLFQCFWKRWSTEYVLSLQRRSKWLKVKSNLQIGDLVIIKEDNIPPLKWKLGRITELYPSADNHVRVVNIKTTTGMIKRPIHKLSVLPVND